jgi:hypothetical protein
MQNRREKETAIEDRVVKWAKAHDIMVRKMNGLGNMSWPDRMFVLPNGIVAFIELKRPGKSLTPLQNDTLRALVQHKVHATWADDSDAAIEWLAELLKLRRTFAKR